MFFKLSYLIETPTELIKFCIYTDGNNDYISALQDYFSPLVLTYGQKVKSVNGEKVFPAIKKAVFGTPDLKDIDTNMVECFNTILRARLSRLVRKTQGIAKNSFSLEDALYVFQFYWNFIHLQPNKLTPAMMECMTNKQWTWGMFLHVKLTIIQ